MSRLKWKVVCVVRGGVTQEVGTVNGTLDCGEEASSAISLEIWALFSL
jgi:hypothetical protein